MRNVFGMDFKFVKIRRYLLSNVHVSVNRTLPNLHLIKSQFVI